MGHQGASISSFLMYGNIENLLVRLQHLKILLVEAVSTQDPYVRDMRLLNCIKYHIAILE